MGNFTITGPKKDIISCQCATCNCKLKTMNINEFCFECYS